MLSRWNRYLETKLRLRLTTEGHQLADAIARCTLGWNKEGEHLGEGLLRERSGLRDGRSFARHAPS